MSQSTQGDAAGQEGGLFVDVTAEEQSFSGDEALATTDPGEGTPQPVNDPASAELDTPQPTQDEGLSDDADPSSVPDKENPERFQYWQSQAQQAQAQLEELSERVSQFETLEERLQQNPELIAQIAGGEAGQPTSVETQGANISRHGGSEQMEAPPQRPQPPEKPADYDPWDAQNVPESESFRYKQKHEEYLERKADYAIELQEWNQHQQQVQAQQREVQQQIDQFRERMIRGEGMSPDEADEALEFFQNPNVELDDLITLWKVKNSETGEAAQRQQRADELRKRKERLEGNVPPAASLPGPVNEPTGDDEQLFTEVTGHHQGVSQFL